MADRSLGAKQESLTIVQFLKRIKNNEEKNYYLYMYMSMRKCDARL
jgi:hypothetical protein